MNFLGVCILSMKPARSELCGMVAMIFLHSCGLIIWLFWVGFLLKLSALYYSLITCLDISLAVCSYKKTVNIVIKRKKRFLVSV